MANIPSFAERNNKRSSGLGKLFNARKRLPQLAAKKASEQARIALATFGPPTLAGARGAGASARGGVGSAHGPLLLVSRPAPVAPRDAHSQLCDVLDSVLRADIKRFLASYDDPVYLAESVRRSFTLRKLNHGLIDPAELYRAWCAELAAAATPQGGEGFTWQAVFHRLSNAQNEGCPTAASHIVKEYCSTFLTPYLAANPADAQPAPVAQAAPGAPEVSGLVPRNADAPDAVLDAPDAAMMAQIATHETCPPTPRGARGTEEAAAVAAAVEAPQAVPVTLKRKAVDEAAASPGAHGGFKATASAEAGSVTKADDCESDDEDDAPASSDGADSAAKADDDVVYMGTTRYAPQDDVVYVKTVFAAGAKRARVLLGN